MIKLRKLNKGTIRCEMELLGQVFEAELRPLSSDDDLKLSAPYRKTRSVNTDKGPQIVPYIDAKDFQALNDAYLRHCVVNFWGIGIEDENGMLKELDGSKFENQKLITDIELPSNEPDTISAVCPSCGQTHNVDTGRPKKRLFHAVIMDKCRELARVTVEAQDEQIKN